MQSIRLISSILRGKWLVEPNFALSQGSLIASILNNNIQTEQQDAGKLSAFAVSASDISGVKYSWIDGFGLAPKNAIAVVSVKGPLMKADQFCGPLGMETIGSIIKEADNHKNIDGIVLHVDSPGGTVDGTEMLANIVKNTRKPIVTYVDGLMASAALWIGSSADEVIASTDTDEVGSVGVLMSFADVQGYWEKKGVKFHTITASTSAEKVKMWEDLRSGKYEAYIKEVLDPLDEKFMNIIKENRQGVEEKHLTGKVFFARDVMGVFVDSIGSLEDAIQRASELAGDENEESTNLNNNNSMEQFAHVNAALGVDALESADDAVSLNADQMQAIEAALGNADQVAAERDTAVSEKETAVAELGTANANRDTAISERDTAVTERDNARNELTAALGLFDAIDATVAAAETPEAKAEAVRAILAKKPGAKAEQNLDNKDTDANETSEENWDAINNLPHNQAVDMNS